MQRCFGIAKFFHLSTNSSMPSSTFIPGVELEATEPDKYALAGKLVGLKPGSHSQALEQGT